MLPTLPGGFLGLSRAVQNLADSRGQPQWGEGFLLNPKLSRSLPSLIRDCEGEIHGIRDYAEINTRCKS
ncbi:MAG: hypothetical protein ABSH05_17950 [Bryobacteraceae bacterium]|jgi:hypothetical protein